MAKFPIVFFGLSKDCKKSIITVELHILSLEKHFTGKLYMQGFCLRENVFDMIKHVL